MDVYTPVTKEVMYDTEGYILVGTTWVHTNKGTQYQPEIRSRLCAQEYSDGQSNDDLFAATPPLLATRFLLSLVATMSYFGQNLKDDWPRGAALEPDYH